MEIQVLRQEYSPKSTIGRMLIDGSFQCFTLEDRVRSVKIPRETAIPAGRYEVVINMSNRFGKRMPLLLAVPNYEGVRIHNGNTADHTEGCILVGASKSADFVGNSVATFKALMLKLEAAAAREKIFIDVVDEGAPLPAERGARGMPPARRGKVAAKKKATKKAQPKKTPTRKTPAKKVAAKKASTRKAAPRKPAAKKAVVKKPPARKAAARKPATRSVATRKKAAAAKRAR